MKYCVKCGTLLEDSHERCIGCGREVIEPGTWSLYPPEIAKSIEIEQKENKSRTGLIVAMIVVFLLLVAAIAVFIVFNSKRIDEASLEKEAKVTEQVETVEEPEVEEVTEEADEEENSSEGLAPLVVPDAEEKSEEVSDSSEREIKDSVGKYYSVGEVSDLAGNVMFTTLFPEDFSEKSANINYDVYSNRYPESLTYIVGNNDGNVQFTFMSPQHYWYRKSDYKGQTRSNERDVNNYMQFLTYNGAEGYIEALIKQSYTDIKGFKLIDKEEYAADITEALTKTSDDHTRELLGEIGDYAKVGSDTVYAAMQAECESYIYHYEATSRQGNTIYMDFYVPVIANTLGYVSEKASDKGEITEWVVPEFVAFETGNQELHDLYMDDYKLFIYNSKLTDEFFYMNDAYSAVIEDAIKVKREPYRLSAEKLKALHSKYNSSAELNPFGKGVKEFLNKNPNTCVTFSGDKNFAAYEKAKVAFFSKEKNKVFISTVEDEYPGSDYSDLTYSEGTSESASDDSSADSSSSDSE